MRTAVAESGVSNRNQPSLQGATCGGFWQVGLAPGEEKELEEK